jgi:hypothetical protein
VSIPQLCQSPSSHQCMIIYLLNFLLWAPHTKGALWLPMIICGSCFLWDDEWCSGRVQNRAGGLGSNLGRSSHNLFLFVLVHYICLTKAVVEALLPMASCILVGCLTASIAIVAMMFTACLPQHSQNPTRTNRSSGLITNSYLLNKQMIIDNSC